jgi:hypothetical protein
MDREWILKGSQWNILQALASLAALERCHKITIENHCTISVTILAFSSVQMEPMGRPILKGKGTTPGQFQGGKTIGAIILKIPALSIDLRLSCSKHHYSAQTRQRLISWQSNVPRKKIFWQSWFTKARLSNLEALDFLP